MKKSLGFTLTEVLITVGIIGVVAALTVPNLIKNYQKDSQLVQLRKVVNEFVSATDIYTTETGKQYFYQTPAMKSEAGMNSFMLNRFKSRAGNGFANTYKSINGNTKDFTCAGTSFVLANSATVCVKLDQFNALGNGSAAIDSVNNISEYHIYVDTNGNEKPNVGGRDMFDFYITNKGEFSPVSQDVSAKYEKNCSAATACALGMECEISEEEQAAIDKCEADKTCIGKPFGESCIVQIVNDNWQMNY